MGKPIIKVADGLNVTGLLWALQAHPELWNRFNQRTVDPESPHHEVDDIWVRYAGPDESKKPGPHEPIWYPAADVLPVKDICLDVMRFAKGTRLGGVLITKIPAGKSCKPHIDDGWHALYYQKFAVQIQSSPGQFFCFDEVKLEPMPGDIYWFNNQQKHWVENPTPHDRITMIVCVQSDFRGE